MADPFSKVTPGDKAFVHAAAWNAALDAASSDRAARLRQGSQPRVRLGRSLTTIRVKNVGTQTLARYYTLPVRSNITLPLVLPGNNLPEFQRVAVVEAKPLYETPSQSPWAGVNGFCVLLEPAPVNAIVEAAVEGVVPAQVQVLHETDTYAHHSGGVNALFSSKSPQWGGAKILWKDPGPPATGVKWCLVHLNSPGLGLVSGGPLATTYHDVQSLGVHRFSGLGASTSIGGGLQSTQLFIHHADSPEGHPPNITGGVPKIGVVGTGEQRWEGIKRFQHRAVLEDALVLGSLAADRPARTAYITSLTLGATTQVTTESDHGCVSGDFVCLYGMQGARALNSDPNSGTYRQVISVTGITGMTLAVNSLGMDPHVLGGWTYRPQQGSPTRGVRNGVRVAQGGTGSARVLVFSFFTEGALNFTVTIGSAGVTVSP